MIGQQKKLFLCVDLKKSKSLIDLLRKAIANIQRTWSVVAIRTRPATGISALVSFDAFFASPASSVGQKIAN